MQVRELRKRGAPLKITLSCGVAEHSAGDTVESLMERADKALYDANKAGEALSEPKVATRVNA